MPVHASFISPSLKYLEFQKLGISKGMFVIKERNAMVRNQVNEVEKTNTCTGKTGVEKNS